MLTYLLTYLRPFSFAVCSDPTIHTREECTGPSGVHGTGYRRLELAVGVDAAAGAGYRVQGTGYRVQAPPVPLSAGDAWQPAGYRVQGTGWQPAGYRVQGRELKGGSSSQSVGGELVWGNPQFGSFDDFGQAMLILLVLSSGDLLTYLLTYLFTYLPTYLPTYLLR